MSQQLITNGESGLLIRNAINGNFTELYSNILPTNNIVNQNSNYTVPDFLVGQQVNGTQVIYKIVGDGNHSLSVPSTWININGIILDNGRTNYLIATYTIDTVMYSVYKTLYSFAQAFSFSASTSTSSLSYINPAKLQFGSGVNELPMSFSLWINIPSLVVQRFFLSVGGTSVYYADIAPTGAVSFVLQDAAGNYLVQTSQSSLIPINIWTHLTFTYDGFRTTAGMKMYVNGNLTTLIPNSSGVYGGRAVFSGSDKFSLLPSSSLNDTGLIDEVFFYNIVLNSTQVTELYNGGAVKNPSTYSFAASIVDGWRFENNPNSFNGGYNLTPTGSITYSSNHP